MPSDIGSVLSQVNYRHPELTKRQVQTLVHHYKGLSPKKDKFTFNDGQERDLINIQGTIPVPYRGQNYNIPVSLYLLDTHPYHAPLCYVKPTPDMQVKVSKHVDAAGKIYLPYLHEWAHPQSDLVGLVQICIVTFSEQPPVYAKPKQPAGLPYPMQPQGGGYPGSQQGYPAYPPQPQAGGGGYPPAYPAAGGYPPAYPPQTGYGATQGAGGPGYPPYPSQGGGGGYPPYPPAAAAAVKITRVEPKRELDESFLSMQFRLAESQFARMTAHTGQRQEITSVDVVENNQLRAVFKAKQKQLEEKGKGKSLLLFHGTPQANIKPILQNNFDISKITNGRRFGNGVYFSERPEVSLGYSRDQKSLILCEVLLGDNSKEVKTEGDGRAWAVVVPDTAQILPRFVINFK